MATGSSDSESKKEKKSQIITYDSYLKVPKILSSQEPITDVPEEGLFILVHQAFELWFKQVIADIDCVRHILQQPSPQRQMVDVVKMLERVLMIFKLVIQQFAILETMPPMEFMNFRGYLFPASGFQSLQFRLLEIKLGVREDTRITYDGKKYTAALEQEAIERIDATLAEPSLLIILEKWLETTPGLDDAEFNFVDNFRRQVQRWQADCGKDYSKSGFEDILDESKYQEHWQNGSRRVSRRAFLGALLIFLYRQEPALNLRYSVLKLLLDIETALWQWRTNHVMMVHRMIGCKTGTAGSSGVGYLKGTLEGEKYRVFVDLFNVATYLVPSDYIPPLPGNLKTRLAFAQD